MKTKLTLQGTEEQINLVLQPLSLLPAKEAVFLKTAIKSNLNDLLIESKEEQYKEVLESVLSHVESNLINLDSSGYLLNDIKKVLS